MPKLLHLPWTQVTSLQVFSLPGMCLWKGCPYPMSMPMPTPGAGVPHPGGLAEDAAPDTPDQPRFEWPWRWAGRLISSWETSGKQAGGRSVRGAEEEGKGGAHVRGHRSGGNAGKSPGSPRAGAARDPPACLGCSTPCAAHRGDSLGGLGLINANSSAVPHFSCLAGMLGSNSCRGSRCNEWAALLVGLMIVSHCSLLLGQLFQGILGSQSHRATDGTWAGTREGQ